MSSNKDSKDSSDGILLVLNFHAIEVMQEPNQDTSQQKYAQEILEKFLQCYKHACCSGNCQMKVVEDLSIQLFARIWLGGFN